MTHCGHRHCKALQSTDPCSPRAAADPQPQTDRQQQVTAHREGRPSCLVSHKATVGLECDMAWWKKITNTTFFLIHPPSCSRLEQNSSIIPQGVLKPEPVQGKGGSPAPHANTHSSDRTRVLAATQFRHRGDSGHLQLQSTAPP